MESIICGHARDKGGGMKIIGHEVVIKDPKVVSTLISMLGLDDGIFSRGASPLEAIEEIDQNISAMLQAPLWMRPENEQAVIEALVSIRGSAVSVLNEEDEDAEFAFNLEPSA